MNGDFTGDGRAEVPITSPWGLGVLELSGSTLTSPVMAPNGTRFGGWLLNTADNRFEVQADLDGDGKQEILVSSPWGIGVLKREGGTFTSILMAQNGTRFGGWLLNTADNRFGPVGDFDGDGRQEVLITSPWGIGILKLTGSTFSVLMMAPNGTRFGEWLLNTADNRFGPVGDFGRNGRDELLVTSPWGLGVLELSGGTLTSPVMAPNGTRFGGWLLNTADNHFGNVGDFDGDGTPEVVVTSPWGIGILGRTGGAFAPKMMAPNGTRFGGWLLNTADNRFGPVADFDGDGRQEILVASPWGLGILELAGGTLAAPMMQPNGTRFGGWLLNTADNRFDMVGDFDRDGRAEIVVTSPWGIGVLKQTGGTCTSLMLAANGTRLGGWLLDTAVNHVGIGTEVVRVHVKILTDPTIPIDQMLTAMQQVYEAVGIRVHRVSTEWLTAPALNDLDVGRCVRGETTAEQNALFANRNGVAPGDVVVYFVRSTVPPTNGCAAHPAGQPSAAVVQGATRWTLAHEVGHVLGLNHVADNNRLMTGGGTANITNPPPDLIPMEVIEMKDSTLTHAE
ncbi:FG-GAP-like repeat-containing protein [Actinokineospora sp. NPDC004072]